VDTDIFYQETFKNGEELLKFLKGKAGK
jgi:hypothetical protein